MQLYDLFTMDRTSKNRLRYMRVASKVKLPATVFKEDFSVVIHIRYEGIPTNVDLEMFPYKDINKIKTVIKLTHDKPEILKHVYDSLIIAKAQDDFGKSAFYIEERNE